MTTHNWRKHSLTWGKRLAMVFLLMVLLIYGVLSLAQRSSEPLRKGLEDYLTKQTGHRGEITDLRDPQLIPDTKFDIRGLNIRDFKSPDKIYAHADSVYIALPFWRMLIGTNGYNAFEIKGLEIATGYIFPQKLTVNFAGISDPTPGKAPAEFIVEGEYNKLPLLITMEMDRIVGKKASTYKFGNSSFTTYKIGNTEGDGVLQRRFANVSFESARLRRGEQSAEFTIENIDEKPLNLAIKGKIDGVGFNAVLTRPGQTTLLMVKPESSTPEDIKTIKNFVDGVTGDLGLKDKTDILQVTVSPDAENNASSEQNAKDSPTP